MGHRFPGFYLVPAAILFLVLIAALSLQPAQVAAAPALQPDVPHTIEGRQDCLMCHKAGGVVPVPASHASYTDAMCLNCHKVAAASAQPTEAPAQPTATLAQPTAQPTQAPASPTVPPMVPAAQPTAAPTQAPATGGPPGIPHTLEGRQDCLQCHNAGGVVPFPASHAGYTDDLCLNCHKPLVAAQPTQPAAQPTAAAATPAQPTATKLPAQPGAPSLIPHGLEGRSACSTCHGIAGIHPYPRDHIGRPDSGCLQCHVPAGTPGAGGPVQLPPGTQTCLSCHQQTDLTMTLPGGDKLSLYVDGQAFGQSVHGMQGLECTACHTNITTYPHPAVTVSTERELNRGIIQQACASCHPTEYNQYKDSVHGKALLEQNNLDVPSCTDCHGVHNISNPTTALFRLDSPDLCSKCHANAKLMSKYGISANVTQTYLNDFHGETVRLQADRNNPNITAYTAVCYDCHGIHNIKAVTDPNSSVIKANLLNTCRKCHPNADANFPSAWMAHYTPSLQKWPVVYLVNLFYWIVIPLTVGGMAIFIGADIWRTMLNRRRSRRGK